jgi:hypothetical protein
MAPQPKPPGQRRRRNAGQSQWQSLPASGRSRADMPELPGEEWLDSTIEWWNTIWTSPMATAWVDADVDAIVRLARMRDEFHRGELPVSAFGAMQALEDRFGLSPKSRRALQWEIAQGDVVELPKGKRERKLRAVES